MRISKDISPHPDTEICSTGPGSQAGVGGFNTALINTNHRCGTTCCGHVSIILSHCLCDGSYLRPHTYLHTYIPSTYMLHSTYISQFHKHCVLIQPLCEGLGLGIHTHAHTHYTCIYIERERNERDI